MKKVASILIVVSFVLQHTNQVWILLAFHFNQNYIASALCVNRFEAIPVCKGSCFLSDIMSAQQENESTTIDLKVVQAPLILPSGFCQLEVLIAENVKIYLPDNISPLLSRNPQSVFKPPCILPLV